MAQYTIEDIEILRQKSGISYEEAVNLLEYHNGSLARALVDLEKNGRLHSDHKRKHTGSDGVFNTLYRLRLKVTKNGATVVNLSSMFSVFVILMKPAIAFVGLIASLILGYHITVERDSDDFSNGTLEDALKNAKNNVQNSVGAFTRQFTHDDEDSEPKRGEAPAADSAPSGTRPVHVQFPHEGDVNIHDDEDGYHEADIQ